MPQVLVIGNGGREHAICEALKRSPQNPTLFNFGTGVNPGIKNLCEDVIVGDIMDMDEIYRLTKDLTPDLVIVGPDDPIGAGAADVVKKIGIPCFAPSKACAQLESSKSFTRNLLQKYQIPGNPEFYVSTQDQDDQRQRFYDQFEGQIVVKADGLLGGKGVIVADEHFATFEEADVFARKSIEKFGRVVLEEKFIGEEFSLISIVDGETVLDTPAIQDYKRAYDGNQGPNTGGMGCVSDEQGRLPFLTPSDLEVAHQITVQTMKAIKSETGEAFVGVMYGGFIKTKHGIRLIEYNARFGDPEALNILPLLENDFLEVCQKATQRKLSEIGKLQFKPLATVVRYLCPEGYPTHSVKNVPITTAYRLSPNASQEEMGQIFFASVAEEDGQLLLKGSRAIGILGMGSTIEEARAQNEALIEPFEGPLFYRKDIGTREMMEEKVTRMKKIMNQ